MHRTTIATILLLSLLLFCPLPSACFQQWFVDQHPLVVLNTSDPGMTGVRQVAVDNAGNVYVADSGNNRVVKLSMSSGSLLAVFTTPGTTWAPSLSSPYGVTTSSSGLVYVADTANARIVQFDQLGDIARVIPLYPSTAFPTTLAVDVSGNVYYVDSRWIRMRTPSAVIKLDSSGNLIQIFNSTSPPLLIPAALTVDATGNVYVVDASSSAVFKFSPTGTVLTVLPFFNYTPYSVVQPTCIAVDSASNVFVGDSGSARVLKMDQAGNLLAVFNGSNINTGFNPFGCTIDNAGRLYIANARDQDILITSNLDAQSSGIELISPHIALTTCITFALCVIFAVLE